MPKRARRTPAPREQRRLEDKLAKLAREVERRTGR
jgi:hypothetical protein